MSTSQTAFLISYNSSKTAGSILYVGGTGPGNFTSIQQAIDNASTDDIIFVYDDASPYYENILINKTLALIGENHHTTIIDGNESNGHLICITANSVMLTEFTLRHSGGIPNAACLIISSHHNIITKNHITCIPHHGQEAIWLNQAHHNTIHNNTISSHHYGIWLEDSNTNTITQNHLTDMWSWALILGDSSTNQINNNTIIDNNGGIYLRDSIENTITHNTIEHNYRGISLTDQHSMSTENIISYNNFINNGKTDATFYRTRHSTSKNNWNYNFWDRPRTFPKIIIGAQEFIFIPGAPFHFPGLQLSIPWINFDWHPASQPHTT
jgi:parallel beta-helix repeat protein